MRHHCAIELFLMIQAVLLSARAVDSTPLQLLAEIQIHRQLRHPRVVGFDTFFEDDENVYLMLELCTNQSLMDLMHRRKHLLEDEARLLMLEMVEGVRYLHANNVIHRDLKLGNVFLDHGMHVKLGDFGLAAQLAHSGERKRTVCGTPNYIAPEVLDNSPDGHSFEVDVWALGVILFTLIAGKPPFQTKDVKSTYSRIRKNQYEWPEGFGSRDARHLVAGMLASNPRDRPTLREICMHPFFTAPGARVPPAMHPAHQREAPLDSEVRQHVSSKAAVEAMWARRVGDLRLVGNAARQAAAAAAKAQAAAAASSSAAAATGGASSSAYATASATRRSSRRDAGAASSGASHDPEDQVVGTGAATGLGSLGRLGARSRSSAPSSSAAAASSAPGSRALRQPPMADEDGDGDADEYPAANRGGRHRRVGAGVEAGTRRSREWEAAGGPGSGAARMDGTGVGDGRGHRHRRGQD